MRRQALLWDRLLQNPSVKPEDEQRLNHQALAIYKLLRKGPATNTQFRDIAMQYNARVWEIRRFLDLEGKGERLLLVKKLGGGVNLYAILKHGEKFESQYPETARNLQSGTMATDVCLMGDVPIGASNG